MLHTNGSNGKTKGHAIFARGGVVKMDDDLRGGSVLGDSGTIYRVDFDLGGRVHCQCKGFEHTGWCKHLAAAYMVASGQDSKPEDGEPTDEEWAAMQEDEDRAREYILDAGLDYGDMGSAAYALGW